MKVIKNFPRCNRPSHAGCRCAHSGIPPTAPHHHQQRVSPSGCPFFLPFNILTPFFFLTPFLFRMLRHRRSRFVRRAGIYVRHPPPFYVPSTWVLCAFFETPLTTIKPTICLFYTKPPENQPINLFSPIRPIRPINSHHSHPSHPSFFFHSPRCHRALLRPLPGHSMPSIPQASSRSRTLASVPSGVVKCKGL